MVGKKISKTILKANHTKLPSNLRIESTSNDNPSSLCEIPYGAPPNVHNSQACKSRRKTLLPSIVSLKDRKSHTEAFVVSFMTEHSLPFTLAPHLIQFLQDLSKNVKCLQSVTMARTTALSKLQQGLAASLYEDVVSDLRSSFFSLNADESM